MASFDYDNSSLVSDFFFSWCFHIIDYYKSNIPSAMNTLKIPESISIKSSLAILKKNWKLELKSNSPNFFKAMMKTIYKDYIKATVLMILVQTTMIMQALLIKYLVTYIGSPQEDTIKGALYTLAFSFLILIGCCLRTNSGLRTQILIGQVKGMVSILISEKVLKVNSSLVHEENIRGKIINSMSSDLELLDLAHFSIFFWCVPVNVTICIIILIYNFGKAGLIGIGISILHIPLVIIIGGIISKIRKSNSGISDGRVKLIENLIEGIRVMKLYGWEVPYLDRIFEKREEEMKIQKKITNLNGILHVFGIAGVCLIAFASMALQVEIGNFLYPAEVFLLIALFFNLHLTIVYLTTLGINAIFVFKSIMKRTGEVLLLAEIKNTDSFDKNHILALKKAKFSWTNTEINQKHHLITEHLVPEVTFSVSKISFNLPQGSLLMIVGPVGSGKSTLINGITGELDLIKGSLNIPNSIGYAPEEPWLVSGSIKENILMGRDLDFDHYKRTLFACGLEKDLELFENHDETLIGDRGVMLSGGQRARVSLARAVYSQAEVFVMDDPLSAVDAEVANHIVQYCIKDLLKGKTVVIATHQLQYLSKADYILVLNEGTMMFYGNYGELQENQMVSQLLGEIVLGKKEKTHAKQNKTLETGENCEKLLQASEQITEFKLSAFIRYLKFGFNSNWLIFLVFFLMCISQVIYLFNFYWASEWSKQIDQSSSYYVKGMGTLVALCYFGVCLRIFFIINLLLRSSSKLHNNALQGLAMAPSLYFDENPTGWIIDRFSKDIGVVDGPLQYYIYESASTTIGVFGLIIITVLIIPYNLIALAAWLFFLILLEKRIIPLTMQFRHIELAQRTPILSTLNSMLNGLPVIRCQKLAKKFKREINLNVSNFFQAYITTNIFFRFNNLYADFATGVLIIINVILVVTSKDSIDLTLAAYSLSCSLSVSGFIVIWAKNILELVSSIPSAYRLMEYSDIQNEGKLTADTYFQITEGKIEFENIYMKYKPNLPFVLSGLSFTITPGEKVGIIGRTGAGKSSILQVLFRLVNPVKGTIYLDGHDYLQMGLHDLRKQISVIPQTAVLFAASIKENLDPFHLYTDEEILKTLDDVMLKSKIIGYESGIYTEISTDQISLSAGEKQLLCLARVILRKNKIVVMDEATANVDNETDRILQDVVKRKFKKSTLLVIAHRIRTVIGSDAIMVIDNGVCKEYGNPREIYDKDDSLFKQIVLNTGAEESQYLIRKMN